MAVERYRRKPKPADQDPIVVARYGGELKPDGSLLEVARLADPHAELAVVSFENETVLVARWFRSGDEHPGGTEYLVIHRGKYLAYSVTAWFLFEEDDAGLKHWYEPEGGA